MDKSSLGDRMKIYENVSATKLMPRTPVLLRLDGKAFHTFTKDMKRPFDERLIQTMQQTTRALVGSIDGCNFGYTQSDEISLLLTDYKKLTTQAWFDYKVQKIASIAASMCTGFFNTFLENNIDKFRHREGYTDLSAPLAFFDARVFNIPREEVVNCLLWRQQDCIRNSIQMVGQANFSHKQLQNKSCEDIQEMLFQEKGITWNDLPTHHKRGTAVYKRKTVVKEQGAWVMDYTEKFATALRTEIYIDKDIPIFSKDRDFIQRWVDIDKEDPCEKDT